MAIHGRDYAVMLCICLLFMAIGGYIGIVTGLPLLGIIAVSATGLAAGWCLVVFYMIRHYSSSQEKEGKMLKSIFSSPGALAIAAILLVYAGAVGDTYIDQFAPQYSWLLGFGLLPGMVSLVGTLFYFRRQR